MSVTMKSTMFLDVMLCNLVDILPPSSGFKSKSSSDQQEAVSSFQMMGNSYQTMRYHVPDDSTLKLNLTYFLVHSLP
jgi:hypothetical protein